MVKKVIHQFIIKAIVMMALLFCIKSTAQTSDLGSWSVISAKYLLNKNTFLLLDGQLRSQQFYADFNYYEFKAGWGYNFPKNGSVLLSMGNYTTYQPDGNFKNPHTADEFRIWEQFILNNNFNRLKLEHRYRLEQRFTSSGYRNRFRYRLNAIYPINHVKIQKNTLFVSIYDELFVNNEGIYFEQNRVYGGIGYQINNRVTVQTGLLKNFYNLGLSNHYNKNFLQTMLLFSLNDFNLNKENNQNH